VTKQRYHGQPNHWWSPELFPVKMRLKIALGTAGVLVAAATHIMLQTHFFGPYLVMNVWVILYAWLQHTSPTVPHYGEDIWTWLLGSLATIDRPYPWFINILHHHAGTTHVCQYTHDPTPILRAVWNTGKTCHYVDGLSGVQYYRSIF
jgi:omega-6 fatty acid desaturase (delta-12 desaturase)